MRTKEAEQVLNVSHATVHNWIKSGKLKLNKVLDNGYMDINDESVYECTASTYEPSLYINRIIMVSKDGTIMKFSPSDEVFAMVAEFLSARIISA